MIARGFNIYYKHHRYVPFVLILEISVAVVLNIAYMFIFTGLDPGLMALFYTTLGFTVLTITIAFMRRIFAYLAHIVCFIMASLDATSLSYLVLKACDVGKERIGLYYAA